MNMKNALLFFSVFWGLAGSALAVPALSGFTDKPPANYMPGEKIVFSFTATDAGTNFPAHIRYEIAKDGTPGREKGFVFVDHPEAPATITTTINQPGFVCVTAVLVNSETNDIKNAGNRSVSFGLGAGAGVSRIANIPEPEDFDAFWSAQKAIVDAVDISSVKLVPYPAPDGNSVWKEVNVYTFSIPFPEEVGIAPATGFVILRKDAKEDASLPIQAVFNGYGSSGQKPAYPWGITAWKGHIEAQINAHGFELGRDSAYYKDFMNNVSNGGQGGGYAFRPEENKKPETCYFRGMLMRDLLALRFLRTLPQWNGKILNVRGGSQGGFQSIAMAALDKTVTEAVVEVPWLCDLGGAENNKHIRGWFPGFTPALRYFDTVNFGKRVTVKTNIDRCGLIDFTCPSSGIQALYNALKGPKTIRYVQNWWHRFGPIPKDLQQQSVSEK